LKRKGFKEEIVIKIGLYDLVTSTTPESNKSLAFLLITFLLDVMSSMLCNQWPDVMVRVDPNFFVPERKTPYGQWPDLMDG
jgi:hypothetical protein